MEVVIITGMSGAGRSRAADWFEDQGYYCVDNMPPALTYSFLDMASAAENNIEKVALVTDLRSRSFFGELSDVIEELRARDDIDLTVLYMEAAVSEIVRRYNEVRRNHPLTGGQASASVIEEEVWHGRTLIYDRAIKYDGHRIAAMVTQYFTVKDGKVEDTLSLRIDKYKYKNGKVDSVFVKIKDKDKKMVEVTHSCDNENPLECYTGPNATFNPYSASELVYEHLRQGEEEPKLFEKFDTTDSTMRVIKYCQDEDFSFEIREALPKSNYPGAEDDRR